jgi:hypothetical protein
MIAGVLMTHATVVRPRRGDWEYALWAIGFGHLKGAS